MNALKKLVLCFFLVSCLTGWRFCLAGIPSTETRSFKEPIGWEEEMQDPRFFKIAGKDVSLAITEVPQGEYILRCFFKEDEYALEKYRIFDVLVNGKEWLTDFDIRALANKENPDKRNREIQDTSSKWWTYDGRWWHDDETGLLILTEENSPGRLATFQNILDYPKVSFEVEHNTPPTGVIQVVLGRFYRCLEPYRRSYNLDGIQRGEYRLLLSEKTARLMFKDLVQEEKEVARAEIVFPEGKWKRCSIAMEKEGTIVVAWDDKEIIRYTSEDHYVYPVMLRLGTADECYCRFKGIKAEGTPGFRPMATDWVIQSLKVQPDEKGEIKVVLKGKKQNAQLHRVQLVQGEKILKDVKCGFKPGNNPAFLTPEKAGDSHHEPYPVPQEGLWSSPVNVVKNPGFEVANTNKAGQPLSWTADDRGQINLSQDNPHSGKQCLEVKGSCKVTGNQIRLDHQRPFKLEGWIRCSDARSSGYLQIEWFCGGMKKGHGWWYQKPDRNSMSVGTNATEKLRGNTRWQKIVLNVQPPKDANSAQFSLHANEGTVWFDDLYLDGYGEEPIRLSDCQAGYHPNSSKTVLVEAKAPIEKGSFKVVSKSTQKEVVKGQLENLGKYERMQRCYYLADFSALKEPDEYVLVVDAGDGRSITSHPFVIKPTLWKDVGRLGLKYFRIVRDGIDMPDWHGPIRLDDAFEMYPAAFDISMSKQLPLSHLHLSPGGWMDAGDDDQFQKRVQPAAFGIMEFERCLQPGWKEYGNKELTDVLDEAWWGLRRLAELQLSDGSFYADGVGGFTFRGKEGWKPGEPYEDYSRLTSDYYYSWWSDNIPGTFDDRHFRPQRLTASCASIFAEMAYLTKNYSPKISKQCLETVLRTYRPQCYYWYEKGQAEKTTELWRRLFGETKLLRTAIYLHQVTGDKKYMNDAEKIVPVLLEAVEKQAFLDKNFHTYNHLICGSKNDILFEWVHALADFAEFYPKHSFTEKIKPAFSALLKDVFAKVAGLDRSPFGVAGEFVLEPSSLTKDGICWKPQDDQTYLSNVGWAIARMIYVTKEWEYIPLAERHGQWLLGRNDSGMCMVGRAGYRHMGGWLCVLNRPDCKESCPVPGAIPHRYSFCGGVDGPYKFRRISSCFDKEPDFIAEGAGYSEVYEVTAGGFIGFCSAMQRVLDECEKGK